MIWPSLPVGWQMSNFLFEYFPNNLLRIKLLTWLNFCTRVMRHWDILLSSLSLRTIIQIFGRYNTLLSMTFSLVCHISQFLYLTLRMSGWTIRNNTALAMACMFSRPDMTSTFFKLLELLRNLVLQPGFGHVLSLEPWGDLHYYCVIPVAEVRTRGPEDYHLLSGKQDQINIPSPFRNLIGTFWTLTGLDLGLRNWTWACQFITRCDNRIFQDLERTLWSYSRHWGNSDMCRPLTNTFQASGHHLNCK